jgi:tetratricopeptide (TPR) repeat protein
VAAIVTGILGLRSEKRGRAIAGMVLAGLALAAFGILTYLEVSTRRDLNDLLRGEHETDVKDRIELHAERFAEANPASDSAAGSVRRIMSRAGAHIDAGDYDSAIADFTEAIRLDPEDTFAYCGRGRARGYTGCG